MDGKSQFDEISIIDVNDNSTSPPFNFRPGFVPFRGAPPLWAIATNGAISGVSFLLQGMVMLISKGLEGDFSAKTLMWVQALSECFKRVFFTLMTVQQQMREF